MPDYLRIKPHHLIDIIIQYGAGQPWQPAAYGHAEHLVAERVLGNRGVSLEMFSGADDICAPCIHNVNGLCDDTIDTSWRPLAPSSKREWNLRIDRRWYAKLGLADGDRLTADEFARRVQAAVGDDLNDLYPELPADWNARRYKNLQAGLVKFLQPA